MGKNRNTLIEAALPILTIGSFIIGAFFMLIEKKRYDEFMTKLEQDELYHGCYSAYLSSAMFTHGCPLFSTGIAVFFIATFVF